MKYERVHDIIRDEVKNFIDNPIEVVPGYNFSQYETIKRNHLYYNSQFESNELFNGREKIFDNIVVYGCAIESTLLNFDTKDSILIGLNPESQEAEFFLEKELELYLKKNNIEDFYDDCAEELPIYGSIVIKKGSPVPTLVDLRRLFLDPTVDRIENSRFIILKHYLTAQELRAKRGIWDDKVIDKMLKDETYQDTMGESYEDNAQLNIQTKSPYYVVYERYGEVPETFLKGKKEDNYVRSLFITTDPERGEKLILFKSEWEKEYPFLDAHRRKTRGRWLGISAIEEKFADQERTNELANQKRVAMEISALQLFQTSDQTILRNLLKDKQTGDIVRKSIGGEGITSIDTRVKNFTEYQAEEQKWREHADRVSFTPNVLQGGDLPSSMPATNAAIMNTNSTSVHLRRRQRLATTLRRMFNSWILGDLKKSISKEHILKFSGSIDEIKQIDRIFKPSKLRDKLMNQALSGQMMNLDLAESELEKELMNMGGKRFAKIIDKFYKDLEIEYDIIVDSKQNNLQLQLTNSLTILNTLAANPLALNDPRVKVIVYEIMKMSGVNPIKLQEADNEAASNPMLNMPQQGQTPQGEPNLAPQSALNSLMR